MTENFEDISILSRKTIDESENILIKTYRKTQSYIYESSPIHGKLWNELIKFYSLNFKCLIFQILQVLSSIVKFINVADISSMDVIKLAENSFQVAIIGNGIEIIKILV